MSRDETSDLSETLKASAGRWQSVPPPASDTAIQALVEKVGISLPEEYIEFLRVVNGGEGELAADPGWFQLWAAENVAEYNRAYNVGSVLPGFFGVGSSGGGELLAFDMRCSQARPVVMIPFITMHETEARQVAPDFRTFLKLTGGPTVE
jgi:hypothetical protein